MSTAIWLQDGGTHGIKAGPGYWSLWLEGKGKMQYGGDSFATSQRENHVREFYPEVDKVIHVSLSELQKGDYDGNAEEFIRRAGYCS